VLTGASCAQYRDGRTPSSNAPASGFPKRTPAQYRIHPRIDGQVLVYDVNTNTNYNPEAEMKAGLTGTDRSGPIAALLGAELAADVARAA